MSPTPAARARVLLLTPWPSLWSMSGGGGTPMGEDLVDTLLDAGFEIDVVTVTEPGDDRFPEDPRVRVHRLGPRRIARRSYLTRWLGWAELTTRFVLRSLRIFGRDRPAVIYGFSSMAIPAAAICRFILRAPAVGNLFGTFLAPAVGRPLWRLRHFEEVIAFKAPVNRLAILNDGTLGDEVAKRLRVPPERVRFWMHGIDHLACEAAAAGAAEGRRLAGIADGTPLLVSASRLVGWKRVDAVVGVMSTVLARHPDAVLAISGSGPEREPLEQLARELGVQRSVRFLGPLPRDVNLRLIAAADVFCSFYEFSNVGFALLEAMSCGVAIVATDSGATRDFVVDGVHGIVVPHRNDGAAAEAVAHLLDDPELRRRLGEQAKNRAHSEFLSREARKRLELALLDEVTSAPRR